MSDKQKIISVDFDGVIHSYKSGWQGIDNIPDDPIPGAFDWLTELTSGFNVQIFSARSSEEAGILAMKNWFKHHNLPEITLKRLKFPTKKPPAFLTIDDRAVQFTGRFPSLIEVDLFKTWQQLEPTTDYEDEQLLKYFTYSHLPYHLAQISRPFYDVAVSILSVKTTTPIDKWQRKLAIQKLCEAKDCAVRAVL